MFQKYLDVGSFVNLSWPRFFRFSASSDFLQISYQINTNYCPIFAGERVKSGLIRLNP